MPTNGSGQNGDIRVSCSPQHGTLFREGGTPVYRAAALEYYVHRNKRLYEPTLHAPRSWAASWGALFISLLVLVSCSLRRNAVPTTVLLAFDPTTPLRMDHEIGYLLLPASGQEQADFTTRRILKCKINDKFETLTIIGNAATEKDQRDAIPA